MNPRPRLDVLMKWGDWKFSAHKQLLKLLTTEVRSGVNFPQNEAGRQSVKVPVKSV